MGWSRVVAALRPGSSPPDPLPSTARQTCLLPLATRLPWWFYFQYLREGKSRIEALCRKGRVSLPNFFIFVSVLFTHTRAEIKLFLLDKQSGPLVSEVCGLSAPEALEAAAQAGGAGGPFPGDSLCSSWLTTWPPRGSGPEVGPGMHCVAG